ncbi:glycosyltransferase family 9 protein [Elusimicrobiota bacterium]
MEKLNFLLIRFSSLGDVILTTSVVRNIKNNNPYNKVVILTKEQYNPVFLNNPGVDKIINNVDRSIKYDFIIDLHDNIRSGLKKYLIPAKKRMTYNSAAFARRAYLHTGKREKILNKNIIQRYLEPLEKIGYITQYVSPEIFLTKDENRKAKSMAGENYIAIAPGAKWKTKRWPAENYIELVIKIIKEFNLNIVILGDKSDKELTDAILKGVGLLKSHIVNLAGKTNIREAAAVIRNSRVVLSSDSAPMHLGWAVGARIIALFGPTVKEFGFQPEDEKVMILEKDMKCRPCSLHGSNKCKFNDQACMQRIEVYEVIDALKKSLQE